MTEERMAHDRMMERIAQGAPVEGDWEWDGQILRVFWEGRWQSRADVEPTQDREGGVRYDRAVLVELLVYHWPTPTSGCHCGWAELGRSHPEHIANIYEASMEARDG